MDKLVNHSNLKNFYLIKPENSLQKPFILTSAHSGQKTTKYLQNKIKKNSYNYLSMEDMYVNDISLKLKNSGCTILQSNISRIVIDLNRAENEIDPSFILNPPDNIQFNITDKAKFGIGLVPINNAIGEKIYDDKLLWEDIKYKILNYYRPWHLILKNEIDRLLKRFGNVFIIDLHSMPSNYNYKSKEVDFVIGNNFDKSSSKLTREILSNNIQSIGYKYLLNDPYSGGYITKNYSSLDKKVQCIQLEINKKLYMDERKLIKNKNFQCFSDELKMILENFFNDVDCNQESMFAAE